MKSCDDVVDLLPEHLAALGALGPDGAELLEVHDHVRGCAACAEVSDDLLRTLHALRAQAPAAPALPADFADRVMGALPPPATPTVREAGRTAPLAAAGLLLFAAGWGAASMRAAPPNVRVVAPAQGEPARGTIGPRPLPTPPAEVPAEREPAGPGLVDDPIGPGPVGPLEVRHDGGRPEDGPRVVVDAPAPQAPAYASSGAGVKPRGRAAASTEPLERYVEEAGLVVRALGALEQPDPHWFAVLSRRVEGASLIAEGDRLLIAIDRGPASEDAHALRPLISATQVVLRKVRRSSDQDPRTLESLRREVAATGLLEAYRDLAEGDRDDLARAPRPDDPL